MCSIRSICTRLPIKMAEKSLENSRRMGGGGGGGGGPRRNMGKNKPNERRKNTSNRSQQGNHLPKPPFKIETTHFSNIFHSEVCRAAKYKVHAPNCNCSKVDRLRQRYHQEKDRNGNKSLAEQLTNLNISDPFDNLIVVPDTKTTPAIFVCNETASNEFRNNATLCERKLANAIFDGNNDTTSLDALPFKVSCALCLLSHQKNGFVAIVATDSAQELQPVISKARKAASETANHKLHSDHAHFICAVQISSCRSLLQSAKTRSKHGQIVSEILTQLKHGGVDLPSSTDDTSCTIQLGHHLTSLLWLQGKLKSSRRSQYIMVLGYVDGPTELVLDLPGGKRHLGESTLESLVREVKEECSLELDKEWLMERLSRRYGGVLDEKSEDIHVLESEKESGNVYFVLRPTMSNK